MSEIQLFEPKELLKRLENTTTEETVDPNQKRCSRCRQTKPLEEFHHASNIKCGYSSACKSCKKASRTSPSTRRTVGTTMDSQLNTLVNLALSEGGSVVIRRHGIEYTVRRCA